MSSGFNILGCSLIHILYKKTLCLYILLGDKRLRHSEKKEEKRGTISWFLGWVLWGTGLVI